MYTVDKSILNKLINFAEEFEVTPPQSNNVIDWWGKVLQELKESDIKFIHLAFKAAMQFQLADYFPTMLEMLEKRKLEIEILSA